MKNLSNFLIFFLILFYHDPAIAQVRPMISGSLVYARINDPKINIENKIDPAFSVGVFAKKERFLGSLTTNRFTAFVSTKDATNEKTGAKMITRSKAQSDVLSIGYAFNKFAPSILLSNTQIRKKLEYKGQVIADRARSAILLGISNSYFINKNFSISLFYILPSQKLDLESAVGTSINLIF